MWKISEAGKDSTIEASIGDSDKRYVIIENTGLPNSYVDKVDQRILEFINGNAGEMALTQEMDERIAEIFTAPSKHARDIYNLLWTEGLGSSYSEGQKIDLGAVNQLHHNNSLVADDLMDDDDTRRGVPTFHTAEFLNKEFPNDVVDSLTVSQVIKYISLPYAAIPNSRLPDGHRSNIIESLAKNVMDLVEGQNEDLTGNYRLVVEENDSYIRQDGEKLSIPDYYFKMVDGKTGALFEAGAETAAIASEYSGSEPLYHAIEIGRLLQITDDIVDYNPEADKDHLSDLEDSKPTLIVGYGLDRLEGYERKRLREVLEDEEPAEEDLYEVEDILKENGMMDMAYETAEDHLREAKELVNRADFENPGYAQDLNNLADIIYARSK